MRLLNFLISIFILSISTAYAVDYKDLDKLSKNNSFFDDKGSPYFLEKVQDIKNSILIIYNHGSENDLKMDSCSKKPKRGYLWKGAVVPALLKLHDKKIDNLTIKIYRLCSGVKGISWKTMKKYRKELKETGNIILVVGKTEGHLDQSIFAKEVLNEKKGPPPEINLFNEKNNGETVLKLIKDKLIRSAHDVSLGGIMTGIAKMCIKGKKGINFYKYKGLIDKFEFFFSEDQGRYIIEVKKENVDKVKKILDKNSNHYDLIGEVIEGNISINDEPTLSVDKLADYNKDWLNKYMVN